MYFFSDFLFVLSAFSQSYNNNNINNLLSTLCQVLHQSFLYVFLSNPCNNSDRQVLLLYQAGIFQLKVTEYPTQTGLSEERGLISSCQWKTTIGFLSGLKSCLPQWVLGSTRGQPHSQTTHPIWEQDGFVAGASHTLTTARL